MPRRLSSFLHFIFHAATCLSAFLLVAFLILWPLSYCRYDCLSYEQTGLWRALINRQGRIKFQYVQRYDDPSAPRAWGALGWSQEIDVPMGSFFFEPGKPPVLPAPAPVWTYGQGDYGPNGVKQTLAADGMYWADYHYWGIDFHHSYSQSDDHSLTLIVPYSYLTALSALLPTLWVCSWHRRRRNRTRPGFPILPATPKTSL